MLKRVYSDVWKKSIIKFILLSILYAPIVVFTQVAIAGIKIFFLGQYS